MASVNLPLVAAAAAWLVLTGLLAWRRPPSDFDPLGPEGKGDGPDRPLSIVKPVGGPFPYAKECIESFFKAAQGYRGGAELIFSFQRHGGPEQDLVSGLSRAHPGMRAHLVAHPVRRGLTAKGSNLFYGLERARGELLLLSDSDILIGEEQLEALLAPLCDERAVVTAMVRHVRAESLWARLYALAMNLVILGNLLPAAWEGKAPGVAGGAVALTRVALSDVGGICESGRNLADDLALGAQLLKKGYRIVPGPLVDSPVGSVPAGRFLGLMARGMILIHKTGGLREKVVALALFSQGYVLLAMAVAGGSAAVFLLWLAGWALRFGALWGLHRRYGLGAPVWEGLFLPLFDAVGLFMFAAKAVAPTVTWGGIRYRVGPGGRIDGL